MASNYAPTLLPGKIALEHGCAVNGWLAGPEVCSSLFSLAEVFKVVKFGRVLIVLTLHLMTGAADRERSNKPVHRGTWGGGWQA